MALRKLGLTLCAISLSLLSAPSWAKPEDSNQATEEILLIDALKDVRGQDLDSALKRVETLVAMNPNFRLAQLVYGDLLQAKARPIDALGSLTAKQTGTIDDLRHEARSRLQHHLTPPQGVPSYLLQVAPSQKRLILVDLDISRLYLFENDTKGLRLVADYYAASGKNGAAKVTEGDSKTPVGVYFVTGHIPANELPDLYGAGAFPLDYPNPWDIRLGRTGYGIWLHGVPSDTYSRPPRSSNGCVALANADLKALEPLLKRHKTPVIIAEKILWKSAAEVQAQRHELQAAVEKWRRDWESRDPARYANNYSYAFLSAGKNRSAWLAHKNRINKHKRFIKVELSDVSMFADPSEENLVVVNFRQDYTSSNHRSSDTKRQYWQREKDGAWRIVYEGAD